MFSLRYLNGGKSERKKFSELTVNKAILYRLSKEIINDGIINNNKSRREQISDREKQGQKKVKSDGCKRTKLYQNGFSEMKPKSNMSHFSNVTQLKLWST